MLADDGHPLSQPRRETVAEVDSGATADTLVIMPTGPEAKVTLFEEGSHLDNVGQTEADPAKVAMGGMMTFLDTAAPPLDSDIVGPAVSHATVTPSTSPTVSPTSRSAPTSATSSPATATSPRPSTSSTTTRSTAVAAGQGTPMTGTLRCSDGSRHRHPSRAPRGRCCLHRHAGPGRPRVPAGREAHDLRARSGRRQLAQLGRGLVGRAQPAQDRTGHDERLGRAPRPPTARRP